MKIKEGQEVSYMKKVKWITLKDYISKHEKEHIKNTLKETGGNIQHASRLLCIARNTLKSKMNKYNIKTGRST